jgi:hypothetical protein
MKSSENIRSKISNINDNNEDDEKELIIMNNNK